MDFLQNHERLMTNNEDEDSEWKSTQQLPKINQQLDTCGDFTPKNCFVDPKNHGIIALTRIVRAPHHCTGDQKVFTWERNHKTQKSAKGFGSEPTIGQDTMVQGVF